MVTQESDRRIASSIIDLARNLDLCVIAEGVENLQQARKLSALGCEIMQGYLFSKPVPAEELERLMEQNIHQHPVQQSGG